MTGDRVVPSWRQYGAGSPSHSEKMMSGDRPQGEDYRGPVTIGRSTLAARSLHTYEQGAEGARTALAWSVFVAEADRDTFPDLRLGELTSLRVGDRSPAQAVHFLGYVRAGREAGMRFSAAGPEYVPTGL